MLSLCLTFQGTGFPVWEKSNTNVAAKCESVSKFRDLLIHKLTSYSYSKNIRLKPLQPVSP